MPSPPQSNPDASHEEIAPVSVAPDDLVTISRWELDALRAKISAAAAGPTDRRPNHSPSPCRRERE